jgi:hypothetical protein
MHSTSPHAQQQPNLSAAMLPSKHCCQGAATCQLTVCLHAQVHAYLEHAFGANRLQQMSAALAKPSLHTCLRVNTLRTSPQV